MTQTLAVTEMEAPPQNGIAKAEDEEGFIFKGPTPMPLRDINTAQLLDEQRKLYPSRVALISRWQDRRLTYEELHSSTRQVAQSLLAHGVRPKDHVVVLAGNSVEFAQLLFAVGGIGAIFAIINPTITADEAVDAIDFLGRMCSSYMACWGRLFLTRRQSRLQFS
jgi:non-ribosomal peptide synthetase component F